MGVPLVGFVGSRSVPASALSFVGSVVSSVCSSLPPSSVAVGCSVGSDDLVLRSALGLGLPVSLFAVGGPSVPSAPLVPGLSLSGFWSGSGAWLSLLSPLCASVSWFAGGPLAVPLRRRLSLRTRALVSSVLASGGSLVCAFVSGGFRASVGSWSAVRWALLGGLSVVVVPVGCSVSCFPLSFAGVGSVSWVASSVAPGAFLCVRGGLV